MHLTNYVTGPLGRFYNYPNQISAFQYINHQHKLSLTGQLTPIAENITALLVNNEFSKPLVTFYFDNRTILSCELNFSQANMENELLQCTKARSHKGGIGVYLGIVVLDQ